MTDVEMQAANQAYNDAMQQVPSLVRDQVNAEVDKAMKTAEFYAFKMADDYKPIGQLIAMGLCMLAYKILDTVLE